MSCNPNEKTTANESIRARSSWWAFVKRFFQAECGRPSSEPFPTGRSFKNVEKFDQLNFRALMQIALSWQGVEISIRTSVVTTFKGNRWEYRSVSSDKDCPVNGWHCYAIDCFLVHRTRSAVALGRETTSWPKTDITVNKKRFLKGTADIKQILTAECCRFHKMRNIIWELVFESLISEHYLKEHNVRNHPSVTIFGWAQTTIVCIRLANDALCFWMKCCLPHIDVVAGTCNRR